MTSLAKLKVLVVDDNRHVRAVVKSILAAVDVRVDEAGSGAEALRLWREIRPDVVIVDFEMPGMTGAAFTRKLRALEAEQGVGRTPVLLMTAHSDLARVRDAIGAGVDGALVKPLSPQLLFQRIEAALKDRAGIPRAAAG